MGDTYDVKITPAEVRVLNAARRWAKKRRELRDFAFTAGPLRDEITRAEGELLQAVEEMGHE